MSPETLTQGYSFNNSAHICHLTLHNTGRVLLQYTNVPLPRFISFDAPTVQHILARARPAAESAIGSPRQKCTTYYGYADVRSPEQREAFDKACVRTRVRIPEKSGCEILR